MVGRGYVRLAAPLGALLMAIVSVGTVLAADASCVVNVEPQSAVGGSLFLFRGSGFVPTMLTLQKGNGGPIINELHVDGDPWEVTVRSRAGDEGTWTATFEAELGCSASVDFQVVLTNTDVSDAAMAHDADGPPPVVLYLLVVGFGFASGLFLARRLGTEQRNWGR